MRLRAVYATISAFLLATAPASAEFYIAGHAGPSFLADSDFVDFDNDLVRAEFDTGIAVGGEAGFAFPQGFRVGGEITYRENEVDRFRGSGTSNPGGVEVSAWSFMGNGWYEFGTNSPVRPYVGGGIGIAVLETDRFAVGGVVVTDEDDTVFAFQVGGGVAFDVNPKLAITLDYRYFGTADPEFGLVESEYDSHNLLIGARLKL